MKKVKSAIVMLLTIAMVLSASSLPLAAYAAEQQYEMAYEEMDNQERMEADMVARGINIKHITDNSLITNITNPSNGTISFYINVPAGQTLYYTLKLVPSDRMGSIDTAIDSSYKNTSSSKVSKKITVNVKYFSNKYTLSASYTTGNDRERTMYETEKAVISSLKTTVRTNKFVWDSRNLAVYTAGGAVSVALTFGITTTVDILVTKGVLSGALVTTLSISIFAGDFINAGNVADTKTITDTPIVGWGYQVELTPTSGGGYSRNLLVYDENGSIHRTVALTSATASNITLVVK